MNQGTQNYLAIGVVVAAFAVILPIFLRPYYNSTPQPQPNAHHGPNRPIRGSGGHGGPGERPPPHPGMGGGRDFPGGMHGGRPHMGTPHNFPSDQGGDRGGGGRGGIMSIALPIYSIGIVLYVLYVFYKFYTKGFNSNEQQKPGSYGRSATANGAQKPSAEQIQNYKQFLLAKEECAKRIEEERASGNKLSTDQLTQLEERLREAEDAMEKAMAKMGLDIGAIKQETNYKDPLAESLEELKRTMANISTPVPAPAAPTPTSAPPPYTESVKKEEAPEKEKEQTKKEPEASGAGEKERESESEMSAAVESGAGVGTKDQLLPPEKVEDIGPGPGEDSPSHGGGAHKHRRVSFAESINVIDKEQLHVAGEVGDDHAEQDKTHPSTEPEGVYLKHHEDEKPSTAAGGAPADTPSPEQNCTATAPPSQDDSDHAPCVKIVEEPSE